MQYSPGKKPRKISTAVFRGRLGAYSFDVYPLAAEIRDSPAIFVISRRRTDKFGNGHHRTVCIGESQTLAAALKKHRRAKCIKNNEPNVVCIMAEPDASQRAEVVADLASARHFCCINDVYDTGVVQKAAGRRVARSDLQVTAGKTTKPLAAGDRPSSNRRSTKAQISVNSPKSAPPAKAIRIAEASTKTAIVLKTQKSQAKRSAAAKSKTVTRGVKKKSVVAKSKPDARSRSAAKPNKRSSSVKIRSRAA